MGQPLADAEFQRRDPRSRFALAESGGLGGAGVQVRASLRENVAAAVAGEPVQVSTIALGVHARDRLTATARAGEQLERANAVVRHNLIHVRENRGQPACRAKPAVNSGLGSHDRADVWQNRTKVCHDMCRNVTPGFDQAQCVGRHRLETWRLFRSNQLASGLAIRLFAYRSGPVV
jgi:hypothetical protein